MLGHTEHTHHHLSLFTWDRKNNRSNQCFDACESTVASIATILLGGSHTYELVLDGLQTRHDAFPPDGGKQKQRAYKKCLHESIHIRKIALAEMGKAGPNARMLHVHVHVRICVRAGISLYSCTVHVLCDVSIDE